MSYLTEPIQKISPHLQSAFKSPNRLLTSISKESSSSITSLTTSPRVSFLKDAPKLAPCNSFCDLSFDVQPGKPMDEVRKTLQLIVTTLQEIDPSAFIVQFSQSLAIKTTSYEVAHKLLINDASSLPRFSSKFSLPFPGCKPRNNKTYTKIQLIHADPLEDIMEDLKDELSHHNLAICKKALQH